MLVLGLVIIGVILILAGIGGLVFRFIPIHHQEQVAKIGPSLQPRTRKPTSPYHPMSR